MQSPVLRLTACCFHSFATKLKIQPRKFVSPLIPTSNLSAMAQAQENTLPIVFNNVIKSDEDKRDYRGLELVNGMKVLLISDPETDKSAAAMDVNVGHLLDPWELPGLAHFCEHMLFLGTEKYSVENDYQKYLSAHGGMSNAFTSTDHTNYYFDVSPAFLNDSLDRFAQFFISPLFNESAVEREVNAVNSENANNLQNDMWRLAQLERSLSNPKHAYFKFGTGSKVTLLDEAREKGMEPRAELLKFHQQYYSSNVMGLAVLGKQSLDELEEMVVPRFSLAKNKQVAVPEWTDHPYGPEQAKTLVKVAPVKDVRALHITFPIPDLQQHYRSRPSHYLGHLLGHEGPGSLLSELKRRGWSNSLVGGGSASARGFGFFSLDVDLSPAGEEHVDDIVLLVFQYLHMLRKLGAQEWIHRECEELSSMNFRFKDKQNPSGYVSQLSTSLRIYPTEEVLSGPYMMPDYNPELVEMLLSKLTPEAVSVLLVSKKFEGKLDQKEKWYGTEYSKEPMSDKLLNSISNPSQEDCLKLPERNEFVPKEFALKTRDESNGPLPELIENDAFFRVWYLQDKEYMLPKRCLNFQLTSPFVYVDPLHKNLASMLTTCLQDSLNECVYAAELAGLRYSFDENKYSLQVSVRGYDEKQVVLLRKILQKIAGFKPDPQRFDVLKEAYVRSLQNFKMEQPYMHAVYYTSLILSERSWTKEEQLKEAEALTCERLEAFVSEFISNLHCEALIHGNTTKQEALDIVKEFKSIFESTGTRALFASQLRRDREIKLIEGKHYLYQQDNDVHANSAVEMLIQTGPESTQDNMLLELLCQILSEPAFDQLRTKEQLGYIVFSGVRRGHGTQGLRFIVQSEREPSYVEERIETFLQSMLEKIKSMTSGEWEEHKSALAAKRLEKPKTLKGKAGKYWSEITSQQYNFKRDEIEVEALKKITKSELVKFFEDAISVESASRKKLSTWITGTKAKELAGADGAQGDASVITRAVVIKDVDNFKATHPLYPRAAPHMLISEETAKSRL